MTSITVTLGLLTPTCIADLPSTQGQIATTMGYLTGAAIRGACASRWLAGRRPDELPDVERDMFATAFWSDTTRFGAGWPIPSALPPASHETRVVPSTMWTARHNGGWRADKESRVRDVLTSLLHADHDALDELEPIRDRFAWYNTTSESAIGAPVRRQLVMRSANRAAGQEPHLPQRGVAAEGRLYSFEALEPHQWFAATVTAPDEILAMLQDRALTAGTQLHLGARRSTGDGAAMVEHVDTVPDDQRDAVTIADQIDTFSAVAGAPDDVRYLPITLESDVILRDSYLLANTSPAPDVTLGRYLAAAPRSMRLKSAIQTSRWIAGWDTLRGLPRPPQLAMELGSVWVYRVDNDELDVAIRWWLRAEEQGLGEGLNHGFGHVRLLHPFHIAAPGDE